MFADACEKAAKFVRPVIVSGRRFDGKVEAGCGTFFVINDEGWIITAGHIFDSYSKYQSDQNKLKEIEELNKKHSSIAGLPRNELKPDPSWITNHSFWWGWDGVRLTNAYVNRQIDITIGKLEPFDPSWVKEYPVFRDPETMRPGTSLCRLGFPFVDVASDFDETTNSFRIRKGVLPMPLFPNEGMHTRNVLKGRSVDGNYEMLYVETSTPGLRGQSGGPIYDRECRICGVQVQTAHLPLGFHPTVEYEGKTVVENQFLNVGLGVHVKTVTAMLRDRQVKFETYAAKDSGGFRITD
mgnify:FL=1